jgi:decaprenyl-phosphate phosphoribosyltransferase
MAQAPQPSPEPLRPVDDELAAARSSLPRALLATARPKQWAKNILVVAAPAAAGVLGEGDVVVRVVVAFVAFCLAASGTYFFNDAMDADADRAHPVKRHRPVAAGHLGVAQAKVIGVVLLLAAVAVAAPVRGGRLALVVVVYIGLTVAYSAWLKREPVVDLAAVAAGFVLRAIAGGVAAGVPLSDWFLIVAGAGSLFIVAGKRHAEVHDLGTDSSNHRSVLAAYSPTFLTFVRAVAAGVAITAYCIWAFERSAEGDTDVWYQLSVIPFVLGILRYALLVEHGHGGAPEELLLRDRVLLAVGALWAVVFALGVHVG